VQLHYVIALLHLDSHPVHDHERDQAGCVDQDDPRGDVLGELPGARGEDAGGDEDAAGCLDAMERTHKRLHGFAPHRVAVGALCLAIDPVKAECILLDHAINAAVVGAADASATLFGAAVAHLQQELDHCYFEEVGMSFAQPLDERRSYLVVDAVDPVLDLLNGFQLLRCWKAASKRLLGRYRLLGLGQVAGQAATLSQMHAVALNHIEALADGLIITAVALTNMVRMDSLEIVHGAGADAAGAHTRHVEQARERRLELTRSKVQKLADAAAKASKVDTFTRVANPFELPKLYDAISEIQRLLTVFAEGYGMPATAAFERKEWHTSLLDLGHAAGNTVAGVVGAAAGTVVAAPKAIAGGVEDTILNVAQSIEERRKGADADK